VIEILVIIALVFGMLIIGALFLYFIRFIIRKTEKYFLSREESLIAFGVILMAVGWFGFNPLLWFGIGILFADWILNWERITERFTKNTSAESKENQ